MNSKALLTELESLYRANRAGQMNTKTAATNARILGQIGKTAADELHHAAMRPEAPNLEFFNNVGNAE